MSPTLQSLGIDRLSLDERLSLVHDIWDSIAEEAVPAIISDEQKQLFVRRIAELGAHPEKVTNWDEIKQFFRRER